jgi:hypothetical protein
MTASPHCGVEIPTRSVREGGDDFVRQDRKVLDHVNGDPPRCSGGSLPS